MRLMLTVLTLLAILARAVVPGGYMVQASEEGRFEIVICTEYGTDTIWLDDAGNPVTEPSGEHSDSADGTCPFAIGATTVLSDLSNAAPDFERVPQRFTPSESSDQRVRIAILAINAARAPPSLI
jgi:hypothetical protein